MKKLLIPLVALAFGFASISAFAADEPAKDSTTVQKTDKKPVKKARRTSKKKSAAKTQKKEQPAAQTSNK